MQWQAPHRVPHSPTPVTCMCCLVAEPCVLHGGGLRRLARLGTYAQPSTYVCRVEVTTRKWNFARRQGRGGEDFCVGGWFRALWDDNGTPRRTYCMCIVYV